MRKKPKRRNLRPPSRCIFCGGGGVRGNPMSKEHLWPEWMHPYLPKIPNARNWTAITLQTRDSMKTTRKKPQTGHVFTKQIKVVCKKCNETWMGDIEKNMKPILKPIVQGQSTIIDNDSLTKLAIWLTLKFLVADYDREAIPVATAKILSAFKNHQRMPSGLKIWIGYHNVFEWSAGYWSRGLFISFIPKAPTGRRRNNVKTTAFGAGHLFALICLSLVDRVSLEIDNPFTAELWPATPAKINWPLPLLPLDGIATLANVLDDFEARPDVQWGPV